MVPETPEKEPAGCAFPVAVIATLASVAIYAMLLFVFQKDVEGAHIMALYYAAPLFGFIALCAWGTLAWPWIYARMPDGLRDLIS